MNTITIRQTGGEVRCTAPFHPDFPPAARELGGRWHNNTWVFDARDEARVRDLCLHIWGTDGTPCKLVTVRCVAAPGMFDAAGPDTELYLLGRDVARVFERDTKSARLGPGVVMCSGRFTGGGSRHRPHATWIDGTTFELRDVPASAAQTLQAKWPQLVEILGSPLSPEVDAQAQQARTALIEERRALLARLAEIDAALSANQRPTTTAPTSYAIAHDLRDDD